jgi:hypothetical protein
MTWRRAGGLRGSTLTTHEAAGVVWAGIERSGCEQRRVALRPTLRHLFCAALQRNARGKDCFMEIVERERSSFAFFHANRARRVYRA